MRHVKHSWIDVYKGIENCIDPRGPTPCRRKRVRSSVTPALTFYFGEPAAVDACQRCRRLQTIHPANITLTTRTITLPMRYPPVFSRCTLPSYAACRKRCFWLYAQRRLAPLTIYLCGVPSGGTTLPRSVCCSSARSSTVQGYCVGSLLGPPAPVP